MTAVEIVGEFGPEDYRRGYVCAAAGKPCSPHITISSDGVWFRQSDDGLQMSAHRRCVSN
ncbi:MULTISPECIES: hypothetical protein [Mycolicibacterium]|uniref:hypothetical protein n=1 Tax=Mycolicibacterium TaxID=1866885 RepID=UPI002630E7EE|nr:hypothetical protein [Mycolicibacterium fortuitum]